MADLSGYPTGVSAAYTGVYQIETADLVLGGPSGIANVPAKDLAERDEYLKYRLDQLLAGAGGTVPVSKGGFGANNSGVTAGNMPYFSDTGVISMLATTAFGRGLLNSADAAAFTQALNQSLGRFAFAQTETVVSRTAETYSGISGLSLSITPQKVSSKILLICIPSARVSASSANNAGGFIGLFKTSTAGTQLSATKCNFQGSGLGSFTALNFNQSIVTSAVDSPNTTSSVTYLAALAAQTGSEITVNFGSGVTSTLLALEILQ